jgi:hypothetical protein
MPFTVSALELVVLGITSITGPLPLQHLEREHRGHGPRYRHPYFVQTERMHTGGGPKSTVGMLNGNRYRPTRIVLANTLYCTLNTGGQQMALNSAAQLTAPARTYVCFALLTHTYVYRRDCEKSLGVRQEGAPGSITHLWHSTDPW